MSRLLTYVQNVGAGFSHLFNAFTGGLPRYSFSARIGKAVHLNKGWAQPFANLIDNLLGDDHCQEQAREEGLI